MIDESVEVDVVYRSVESCGMNIDVVQCCRNKRCLYAMKKLRPHLVDVDVVSCCINVKLHM